jgi:hypothetical protein
MLYIAGAMNELVKETEKYEIDVCVLFKKLDGQEKEQR